jgi:hypothetical protein
MSDITHFDFERLNNEISKLKGDVHKILELLGGNPIDKDDKGHVGIVNDHEDRINSLEKVVERGKWLLIGMTVPSGFGVASIIGWVIEHFK